MKVTKRQFLKGALMTGTAFALADLVSASDEAPKSTPEERKRPYAKWNSSDYMWTMVIDLDKCDGCLDVDVPRCTQACINGHRTPDDHTYIKVFEVKETATKPRHFFPRPCQQCLNPPCAHVCPVEAAWQRDGDRLTLIDHTRCIGCRLCMAACPYEVRFFFWEYNPKADQISVEEFENEMPFTLVKYQKGIVAKCEFCGLQYIGELPHCVGACHLGALYFGNIKENLVTNTFGETLILDETIKSRAGFRWKEEEGTMPRVFYLPAGGNQK